jgi:hypothetical protein
MLGRSVVPELMLVVALGAVLWMTLSKRAGVVGGPYERWVRVIAALGAIDMVVRLALLAARHAPGEHAHASVLRVAISGLIFLNLWGLSERALGRSWRGPGATPLRWSLWRPWIVVAMVYMSRSTNPTPEWTPPIVVWLGTVVVLAVVAHGLERAERPS